MVLAELDRMQAERSNRQSARTRFEQSVTSQQGFAFDDQSVNPLSFAIEHNVQNRRNIIQDDEASTGQEAPHIATADVRDSGVSDVIWSQLQRDTLAAEEQEKQYKQLLDQERVTLKLLRISGRKSYCGT
ncbi:hypothetical protein BDV34DRAFT_206590 [Aspergillus parasiticus]|uniref:Uncharacterized protein n=1 Tax=Aspergillus parasiticus TaxID=5067 RepID=A0A5N6D2V2_ASPPA|nr:hypothetical protein BDV34DRAFT_206590 [Aspergillus parasiticus]